MTQHQDNRMYRDGGYGWVVLLAVFILHVIGDGIAYSYGLLLVDLVDVFQTNRGQAALPGGLYLCFTVAVGLAAGPLTDIYGYRIVSVTGAIVGTIGLFASSFVTELYQLYITFGILAGSGFGLAVTPALICIIHNFDKRRALANGIGMCGTGVGTFGLSALIGYLSDLYGWRGTLIIMAGINLHSVVCALLLNSLGKVRQESTDLSKMSYINLEYQPDIQQERNTRHAQADITDSLTNVINHLGKEAIILSDCGHASEKSKKEVEQDGTKAVRNSKLKSNAGHFFVEVKAMFRDIHFVTFLLGASSVTFGLLVPIHLLPDQAVSLGITKDSVFWISAIVGIGNTVGRPIFGVLGDVKCINRFGLFVLSIVFAGVATGLSCLDTTFEFKMGYACVYGLMLGGFVTLSPVVLTDIIGVENIGKGYGLYFLSMTFGFALGGPIGGWIYDLTGNYNYSFIVAGSLFLIGAVIFSVPRTWNKLTCKQSRQWNISTVS